METKRHAEVTLACEMVKRYDETQVGKGCVFAGQKILIPEEQAETILPTAGMIIAITGAKAEIVISGLCNAWINDNVEIGDWLAVGEDGFLVLTNCAENRIAKALEAGKPKQRIGVIVTP